MFGYRKSAVGKAHSPLEEKASHRIRAAKSAVDFGVQGAYEDDFEWNNHPQLAEDVKPSRPSINNNVIRPLLHENADDSGEGTKAVSWQPGIEASPEADSNAFANNAIRLAGVRSENHDLVPARDKLP